MAAWRGHSSFTSTNLSGIHPLDTYLLTAVSGAEVDLLLLLLHALDVGLEACLVGGVVRGLEAEQLGQTGAVAVVLDHSELDAARGKARKQTI